MAKSKRFIVILMAVVLTMLSVCVVGMTACANAELSNVSITAAPTKTTYNAGEKFETAGMVVTATYADGTEKAVSNYVISPDGALTESNTSIRITYTENGVSKFATQTVIVNAGGGSIDDLGDEEGVVFQLYGEFSELLSYGIYHEIMMNFNADGTVEVWSYNYRNKRWNVDSQGTYISSGTWTKSTFLGATNISMTVGYYSSGSFMPHDESAPVASDGSLSCILIIPIGSGRSVPVSGSGDVSWADKAAFAAYCDTRAR